MNHLLGGQRREAADIFKVNIYIETDNGTKKRVYRGYGAVVEYIKKDGEPVIRKISGMCYGTWNLAYIQALTEALKMLTRDCDITLLADNDFVCGSISSGRVREWSLNAWRTVKNEPVENEEAWRELYWKAQEHRHQFRFIHLKEKSPYSKEIQAAIKEVREKGQYYQQAEIPS